MTPLPAARALDQYFLDARSRLLDLAALLDRVGRGAGPEAATVDPRMARIRQALEVLLGDDPGKAEQIQRIFSLDYDPGWVRPQPRF
jgi:hypothetical protein